METFNLPDKISTLIFDIDGTLYTNPYYVFEQVDVQIRHFAQLKNISWNEARKMISDFRKDYSNKNGGKKISLGNTFLAFGIPIEESIQWRKNYVKPHHFLHKDNKLISKLTELQKKYKIIAVTNNPVESARIALTALGINDFFKDVVGLDSCNKSKPSVEMLELALKLTESRPEECVSIGDRYDIDLAPAVQLGMGGILVKGVEEIYTLEF